MKSQNLAIWILSLTAALLLTAVMFSHPQPAAADLTIKDRDYQIVTATIQQGGEALYITDVRSDLMAVLVYDPRTRALQPKAVRTVSEMFQQ